MNYIVIDLEMCKVPRHYRTNYNHATETIQIGAVLLDENFEQIATLSQYIHPEHGVLDNFITSLTGIQNSQIKNAPILEEALNHMVDWIGDREYKVMAWSESDRDQLAREIESKNICVKGDFMEADRWIDYQKTFGERFEFDRAVGLEEALGLCDIDPDGRFHDGLDDAVNTARLIRKLELTPELTVYNYRRESAENVAAIGTSLGDLLAGLSFSLSA